MCIRCLFSYCNAHIMFIEGEVSTLAGSAGTGDVNGNGNGARFNVPLGLWFDEKHQSLLVCDHWNNKLKRVSLKGMLNIAISFFLTHHVHHTSSSFHPILSSFFILAKYKQQAMYRQCVTYLVQGLWQLQTQLSSSQLRMAKFIESLKQVIPFSTFSLRFSPPLPLSVHLNSPHTLLTHSSYVSGEASVLQQHAESGETKECQFNTLFGLVLDEATNTCFVVDWRDWEHWEDWEDHVITKITF